MPKSVYERFGTSVLSGSFQQARRWTVKGGETIQYIATQVYPDDGYNSENWRQIAEANGIDDMDAVAVGTVLTIPNLQPTS